MNNKSNDSPSRAEQLSDAAVYRRTVRGQRALLHAADPAADPVLRVLARVNGYTELRRLVDLSPDSGLEMAHAIQALCADRLIERVDDAGEQDPAH